MTTSLTRSPKAAPRDKAIDDLRKRVARCRKASGPDPTHLQWGAIAIIEAAFQLRGRTHHHKREAFIDEMARDMKRRGSADTLEPVTVWWAGKWLLVDGHHRMAAALKALGKDAMIPVTVLHGDIAAALTAASRLNYRVKLSMTRTERLDAAWRYATLVPEASKQLVMESTGVSEGTVSEQRRVAKALLQQWTDADFDAATVRHPGQLSWREAQAALHGRQSPEWDAEEALQVASEAILRMLAPAAKRIHANPEAFARALRGLAPEFPLGILREAFDAEWITGPMNATEVEALHVAKVKQAAKAEIDLYTQQATTLIQQQQAAGETRRGDPLDCTWMG